MRSGDGPGFTVWLTGLSGSGKSTVAGLVIPRLEGLGWLVDSLDGDVVRTHLSRGLSFSRDDRETNVERIGWVASRLTRAGVAVVVSAISPYADGRARARALVEAEGPFFEVHVGAGLETCEARDVKGLYAQARRGELPGFTGIDDPYEVPTAPDLTLPTDRESATRSAERVLRLLAEHVVPIGVGS